MRRPLGLARTHRPPLPRKMSALCHLLRAEEVVEGDVAAAASFEAVGVEGRRATHSKNSDSHNGCRLYLCYIYIVCDDIFYHLYACISCVHIVSTGKI